MLCEGICEPMDIPLFPLSLSFPYLNIPDSDIYIRIPERKDNIQPFELLLIEQTPAKIIDR